VSAPEPSRAKRILKWSWYSATAFVAFMATVKVEDARSNVAGWLHFLGVDQVPALLASANTDWIALVSALVSGLVALVSAIRMRQATNAAREAIAVAKDADPRSIYFEGVKMQEPKDLPGHRRRKDRSDGFH
jgi:F0F1-type ATP synthase membrane subunit c/vacuolar-type H+-ATPase subunit K